MPQADNESSLPPKGDGRATLPSPTSASDAAAVSPVSLHESFTPLVEKAVRRDGTIDLRIIGPGWGSSGYYSEAVLKRDIPNVFPTGTHLYWNHPTLTEQVERPERDLSDLAAVLVSEPTWRGDGMYASAKVFGGYAQTIDEIAEHIGVSILGAGINEPGEAEGKRGPIIKQIVAGESIDFVTRPGAKGAIVSIFESAPGAAKLPDPKSQPAQSAAELIQEAGRVLSAKNEKELRAGQEALQAALKALTAVLEQLADSEEASTEAKESARKLKEARSIGRWLESRLHLQLTVMADDLYGDGYLNRTERKILSGALGDALDAYTATIQAEAPQLYERDLWAFAPDETEMSESSELPAVRPPFRNGRQPAANPTQESKPMSDNTTPTPAAESQPESDALAEARRQLMEREVENNRLREQLLLRDATDFIRSKLAESELPEMTKNRLTKELVRDVPTANGKVNESELGKRVTTAINEAQVEINAITGGNGRITGMGGGYSAMGSTTPAATYANGSNGDLPSLEESEKRIEAALSRLHGGRSNGN
jgi:hypothetical protein